MNHNRKHLLAALLLAFIFSLSVPTLAETGSGGFPVLNEDGFLDEGEYIEENPEDGVWRYANPILRIEVFRHTSAKPPQVWYEAEVLCRDGSPGPRVISADPENWSHETEYPYKLARRTGAVLAVSGDYAQTRVRQKARAGIIIRDGVIMSEKTWPSNSDHFPNLDCLALYADGGLQVFDSNEKTAGEYLEEGAVDVLSFGPWLIRDGQLNERALAKYGKSTAQRVAVGMVEKGHYYFMMLEGRIDRSRGAGISFLAERLLEKGCTAAFNLDGGQTASIIFMGHQLCKMDNKKRNLSSRRAADILAVGYTEQLPAPTDPW